MIRRSCSYSCSPASLCQADLELRDRANAVVELTGRNPEGGLGNWVIWVCPPRFSLPRILGLKLVERNLRELQSLKKICEKTVLKVWGSLKSEGRAWGGC